MKFIIRWRYFCPHPLGSSRLFSYVLLLLNLFASYIFDLYQVKKFACKVVISDEGGRQVNSTIVNVPQIHLLLNLKGGLSIEALQILTSFLFKTGAKPLVLFLSSPLSYLIFS